MKNFKFLSLALLFGVLVIAGCEKVNNQEKVSCDGEDFCPIEEDSEAPSLEIEEAPTVIINEEEGNLEYSEGSQVDAIVVEGEGEYRNQENVDVSDTEKPVLRMMVDEEASSDEIEITPEQTCEALGGTWNEGDCTLQDGSKVYF